MRFDYCKLCKFLLFKKFYICKANKKKLIGFIDNCGKREFDSEIMELCKKITECTKEIENIIKNRPHWD